MKTMRKYGRLFLGIFLLFSSYSVLAENNKASVLAASHAWALALQSDHPQNVTALYAPDALLYATFQNQLDTPASITAYFKKLMSHENLSVKFYTQHIRVFNNAAVNSGLYDFMYTEKNKPVDIKARYTFVYTRENPAANWMIIVHHSSVLPQKK